MPITIVGSVFEAEWERRNVRLVAETLHIMWTDRQRQRADVEPPGSRRLAAALQLVVPFSRPAARSFAQLRAASPVRPP